MLAHLAQRMIDLNQQKQAEIKRFLGWLEARLKIRPDKDGAAGIDSLAGKSIKRTALARVLLPLAPEPQPLRRR